MHAGFSLIIFKVACLQQGALGQLGAEFNLKINLMDLFISLM